MFLFPQNTKLKKFTNFYCFLLLVNIYYVNQNIVYLPGLQHALNTKCLSQHIKKYVVNNKTVKTCVRTETSTRKKGFAVIANDILDNKQDAL